MVDHAESLLDTIRALGVLRVGVKADTSPFSSLDALGRPVAFDIDQPTGATGTSSGLSSTI
jgi:ABC-type amino acid transport substrate-binding protein